MSSPETADPLQSLRELQERERELVDARRLLIARARLEGHSWSEIGAALDVSKQAAWQLFNDEVTAILDRVAKRSGLTEDEAMRLAQEELDVVRRQAPLADRILRRFVLDPNVLVSSVVAQGVSRRLFDAWRVDPPLRAHRLPAAPR